MARGIKRCDQLPDRQRLPGQQAHAGNEDREADSGADPDLPETILPLFRDRGHVPEARYLHVLSRSEGLGLGCVMTSFRYIAQSPVKMGSNRNSARKHPDAFR